MRCYCEAWIYWIAGNAALAIGLWLKGPAGDRTGEHAPFLHLQLLAEPGALIAQAILTVPLFAALLVGARRPTGSAS